MKKTLVFGGWAIPPDILRNSFGNRAVYIDINPIMPKLFDNGLLKSEWVQIVVDICKLTSENQYDVMAGWSTGAMFAYAIAVEHHPKELILLAATPCFCNKEDFHFGLRESVVDQMINMLDTNKDAVLKSFYKRCGLEWNTVPKYTVRELQCGLTFLKQVDLRPLSPSSISVKCYHGAYDRIISPSASKYFCEQIGAEFIEVDAGHILTLT